MGIVGGEKGAGPFTLVAPSYAGFAKMDPTTLEKISQNPDVLKSLLQYHMVPERITTKDVAAGSVKTMEASTWCFRQRTDCRR